MTGPRFKLRIASAVVAAGLVVAACGLAAAPGPRVECSGVPAGHCPELVREAERMSGRTGGPAITAIVIRAINPPCTEQACQGETVVVYADGTSLATAWGWQAAPPAPLEPTGPLPTRPADGVIRPTCIAVPADKCAEFADAGRFPDATPDPTIVAIEVACTRLPCTDALGMGTTTVTREDGTRQSTGWSYSAGPAPTP